MASPRTLARLQSASESKRLELLTFKVDEARPRWDLLYATPSAPRSPTSSRSRAARPARSYKRRRELADEIAAAAETASRTPAAGATARGRRPGTVGARRRRPRPRPRTSSRRRRRRARSRPPTLGRLAVERRPPTAARSICAHGRPWYRGPRPGRDGLVRRLGARRRRHALAAGRAGRLPPTPAALGAVHLDGLEGVRRAMPRPTLETLLAVAAVDVPGGGGDDRQGRARGGALLGAVHGVRPALGRPAQPRLRATRSSSARRDFRSRLLRVDQRRAGRAATSAGASGSPSTARSCSSSRWTGRCSTPPPVLDRFRARRRADLHACALDGYDAGGFYLRNSWGKGWGRSGYALATSEWLRPCRAGEPTASVRPPEAAQVGRGEALPAPRPPTRAPARRRARGARSPRRGRPSAAASSPSPRSTGPAARPAVVHHRVEVGVGGEQLVEPARQRVPGRAPATARRARAAHEPVRLAASPAKPSRRIPPDAPRLVRRPSRSSRPRRARSMTGRSAYRVA